MEYKENLKSTMKREEKYTYCPKNQDWRSKSENEERIVVSNCNVSRMIEMIKNPSLVVIEPSGIDFENFSSNELAIIVCEEAVLLLSLLWILLLLLVVVVFLLLLLPIVLLSIMLFLFSLVVSLLVVICFDIHF